MQTDPLEITLIPSPEDPALRSDEYQGALQDFAYFISLGESLSGHLQLSAQGQEIPTHLGTFTTTLQHAFPMVGTALAAWFAGRYGRKARVKVGDIEVEATTADDAVRLLKAAQNISKEKT